MCRPSRDYFLYQTPWVPSLQLTFIPLTGFSLDEDDVPQVALNPATRERPKSMPPVSSAPQASPGLRGSSTMPTMTDMLASKRGWTAKLRDLEHATFGGPSG
ncbi:hypothetical protein B0H14DRAFT_3428030 [Mycena olivaceomarginata]|nr:hypothetical protein B0H14DRAFT_3428030 [Mycena olivaceomarginata]